MNVSECVCVGGWGLVGELVSIFEQRKTLKLSTQNLCKFSLSICSSTNQFRLFVIVIGKWSCCEKCLRFRAGRGEKRKFLARVEQVMCQRRTC